MRLPSCISLDLLYIHNGDEPSENLLATFEEPLNFSFNKGALTTPKFRLHISCLHRAIAQKMVRTQRFE